MLIFLSLIPPIWQLGSAFFVIIYLFNFVLEKRHGGPEKQHIFTSMYDNQFCDNSILCHSSKTGKCQEPLSLVLILLFSIYYVLSMISCYRSSEIFTIWFWLPHHISWFKSLPGIGQAKFPIAVLWPKLLLSCHNW